MMKAFTGRCAIYAITLILLISAAVYAANPPICPHVIGWNSQINEWAKGAPWVKVIYSGDIAPAHAVGAKVFYRPWDADSNYHDDGNLPSSLTGAQYADLVWNKIKNLAVKPEAVGYRNEFNWDNPTASKRTCREFVNYANRLRTLGYTGKVIFGSFGVGWVDSNIWNDVDLIAAVNASDGVETHEYFDLQVNCCAPWLAFRHRDIAIAQHPYLQSKEWYIGEFGSDRVCGHCPSCDDSQCRSGWRDNNKLTEQQYIQQMAIYRSGCANQVVAVFVFQQGSPGWTAFETMGTSVADWMKTTWSIAAGTLSGTVRSSSGAALPGATVKVNPGNFIIQTDSSGKYSFSGLAAGVYSVTASKAGYAQQTQTGKTVSGGQTTTADFSLLPLISIGSVKQLTGAGVAAVSGIVTAKFPVDGSQTRIYIEDSDRTAGIAVTTSTAVALGDIVEVQGSMSTVSGERLIAAASVVTTSSNNQIPKPLCMSNRSLGGGQFGQQAAVLDDALSSSYAKGANNTGLLVRACGRVTYVDPGGAYFYMDDGSDLNDGSGKMGIRVECSGLSTPSQGSYAVITGISGTAFINSKVVRALKPRMLADLSYLTGSNYLLNPGFETGTLENWITYGTADGVLTGTWYGGITSHTGNWFIGSAANGGTKSGGVYQRVFVPSGYQFQARAWSRVYRADNPTDSCQNRVGVDPTGGTDPTAASVVWSPADTQSTAHYSEWRELATPAVVCSGGYATVFLDMKQFNSPGWHISCFDDAGLYYVP